jgi:hypothetical protein
LRSYELKRALSLVGVFSPKYGLMRQNVKEESTLSLVITRSLMLRTRHTGQVLNMTGLLIVLMLLDISQSRITRIKRRKHFETMQAYNQVALLSSSRMAGHTMKKENHDINM